MLMRISLARLDIVVYTIVYRVIKILKQYSKRQTTLKIVSTMVLQNVVKETVISLSFCGLLV